MNLIALINADMLYKRALSEQVPYFKFSTWIESTVQKEVIQQLFNAKKNKAKSSIPADLIMDDNKKKASTAKTSSGASKKPKPSQSESNTKSGGGASS